MILYQASFDLLFVCFFYVTAEWKGVHFLVINKMGGSIVC